MKMIILLSTLGLSFSNLAGASGLMEATVKEYLFTGSFGDMAKNLEEQLAAEIQKKCPNSSAEVRNILIHYQLGPAASGNTLTTEIVNQDSRNILLFRGHPQATASAVFRCK